ncbi:MAG: polymer-forming cytoskeletal protein [Holophagales bacterium]|jgi:cytoskeletal protein CcmA (bactofilin family)|nr:polymer-forming cytoskeletal protein [Holophagales bacterium]
MNETEQNSGNIVIGNDVTVKGVLHVPNRAIVNGAVDGEITAKELVVGQTGRIVGHAKTERADIYGQINQTLDVSQSLILRSTGKIVGVIQYTEIEIEKGGLVEGKLTQQQSAPAPAPPPPVVVSAPEPKDSSADEEI